MTQVEDARCWAQAVFGGAELGDARRTQRLVDVAARLAAQTGASLVQACEGVRAAKDGAYRWLRNPQVEPEAVRQGGFAQTAAQVQEQVVLAVEDTTTLSYRHPGAARLGDLGGPAEARSRGFFVHSVLLLEEASGRTLGLAAQQLWQRDAAARGQRAHARQRPPEVKESAKWGQSTRRLRALLGPQMAQVIAVCDREADIGTYLADKLAHGERFIVRAAQDRALAQEAPARLFTTLAQAPKRGTRRVPIPQRGGRAARTARLQLRSTRITLRGPHGHRGPPLALNAVLAEERDPPPDTEPLRWLLLTSEPVDSTAAAGQVLRNYSLRWRIEDFHKAWKSGAKVEQLRLQEAAHLERMAAILAFVAVRLLQLREVLDDPTRATQPCTRLLSQTQWQLLWVSTSPERRPPKQPPTLRWAYQALAKLGGFLDTKRTGRAGWDTLWRGWHTLEQRLAGYQLLKDAKEDKKM